MTLDNKLYRFQKYNSIICHLSSALCVYNPTVVFVSVGICKCVCAHVQATGKGREVGDVKGGERERQRERGREREREKMTESWEVRAGGNEMST